MTIAAGFDHHPNCSARAPCHATRASYEFSPQQHRARSNDGRSGGTQCQHRRASKPRRQLLATSMRSACGDAQPSRPKDWSSGAAGRPSKTRSSFDLRSPRWVLWCLLGAAEMAPTLSLKPSCLFRSLAVFLPPRPQRGGTTLSIPALTCGVKGWGYSQPSNVSSVRR